MERPGPKSFIQAFELLTPNEKTRVRVFGIFQAMLSLLDLFGVALIGIVSIISISGSKPHSANINTFLKMCNLENRSQATQIQFIAIIAVASLAGRTLLSILLVRKSFTYLAEISTRVSTEMSNQTFGQSILFINRFTSQNLAYALTTGVERATIGLLGVVIALISDITVVAVLFAGMLLVNSTVAATTFIYFGVVGALIHKLTSQIGESAASRLANLNIEGNEIILEVEKNFREMKIGNREDWYASILKTNRNQASKDNADLNFYPYAGKYIIEIAIILGSLLLGLMLFKTQEKSIAITNIVIFLAASSRIAPAVLRVQQGFLQYIYSSSLSQRTFQLFGLLMMESKKLPIRFNDQDKIMVTSFKPNIVLKGVSYRFKDNSKFEVNVSDLQISPGSFVAIVGPSGSGKSTLVDLMIGVLAPDRGSVTISGVEPTVAHKQFPNSISYVPQEIFMKTGSIRENVCLGYPANPSNDAAVVESLSKAGLGEFISNSSRNLDYQIGERGKNLSGGQKQRLGIARALYQSPKLIFLDEATSALDLETEHAVNSSLKELRGSCTVIVIAHRISTIRDADKIIYLREGKIVSKGTFEEVRKMVPNFEAEASLIDTEE